MKKIYLALALVAATCTMYAQQRYLNEVFTGVTVDTSVIYGVNATVLFFPFVNQAVPQPQYMDVYRPEGDTVTDRPLVLYYHTGNFLPYPQNLGCGGTRRDSAAIEICKRLARMGYVVASCDYRLGWDPQNTDELVRRETLINAAYRGVQDARMGIRYFKKSVAETANSWGIDSTKICLFGQGTGGYITLNTATLDNYLKIPTASDGKFMKDVPGVGPVPMVIEAINGNINGTSYGIVPTTIPGIINPGDTLNYPSHVGYTSNFQLAVNLGGAMADSTWMNPGQTPIVSFHTTTDPYAPYYSGTVIVPGLNYAVVDVVGSYFVGHKYDELNNNDVWANQTFFEELTDEAAANYANSPTGLTTPASGLFPFNVSVPTNSSPWEWTGQQNPGNPASGCNLTKGIAMPYIDSIMMFYAPRACFALNLTNCITSLVGTDEIKADAVALRAMPNPASTQVIFESAENAPIQGIRVYDMQGRLLNKIDGINANQFTLQRGNLVVGTYAIQVVFEKGSVVKQVIFQ